MKKRKVWFGVALALIGAAIVFYSIEQGTAAMGEGEVIEAARNQLLIYAAANHEREWFERKNSELDKLQ